MSRIKCTNSLSNLSLIDDSSMLHLYSIYVDVFGISMPKQCDVTYMLNLMKEVFFTKEVNTTNNQLQFC
jgi:hypothetical protein